jgi:hypothetical protein
LKEKLEEDIYRCPYCNKHVVTILEGLWPYLFDDSNTCYSCKKRLQVNFISLITYGFFNFTRGIAIVILCIFNILIFKLTANHNSIILLVFTTIICLIISIVTYHYWMTVSRYIFSHFNTKLLKIVK